MNESFKNSLKGFKVKGIFIVLGALLVIVLAANAFNTGKGFYVFCGIVAILTYVAFVITAILKNKAEIEAQKQAILGKQKVEAEKAAMKKVFEKQIAQLEKERNDAEFQLAQEKAKAKEAAAKAALEAEAFKAQAKAQPKQEAAQPKAQSKAKKNTKK